MNFLETTIKQTNLLSRFLLKKCRIFRLILLFSIIFEVILDILLIFEQNFRKLWILFEITNKQMKILICIVKNCTIFMLVPLFSVIF